MSRVTRPIPGLFGGVSQQPPAMRHPTQCAEQINGISTTTEGLTKRPGTQFTFTLPLTGANSASVQGSNGASLVHMIDRGVDGLYALVLVSGNLMLYNVLTGAAETVQFPNGTSYLSSGSPAPETDFRCVTVADYTFVVNRKVTAAMTSAVTGSNPTNVAYIWIKTPVVNVAYTVTVNGVPTTVSAGASPTGENIALALRNALATTYPSDTFSVVPGTNIVKMTKASGTWTSVTCSDAWNNLASLALHNGVPTYADLPPRFDTSGFVLPITGQASGAKDVYYVKWDDAQSRYVETAKPGLTTTIDAATMPHQLRPNGAGQWVFERATFETRKVGDEDTNPVPSFIGSTIRSMLFHRNRLGILASDSAVLSRAGSYFNFFASSATQVLDTDPIDLAAPSEQTMYLEWAVPFNKDLVIFSSTKQQFVLTGGDILSPTNARMEPSTTFEAYSGARPAELGNRMVFWTDTGNFGQMSMYRISEDTISNRSDDLTEHVPYYVPASPRALAVSTAAKMVVVVPRGISQTLAVFKYETDEKDQMTQKAWQKVTFESPDTVRIMAAYWRGRKLYLVLHSASSADVTAGGRYRVEVMDFEAKASDDQANFSMRLDTRVKVTAGTYNSGGGYTPVTLPFLCVGTPALLKCVAGSEPVQLAITGAPVHNTTSLTTTFNVLGNVQGSVVWAGRPYLFRYVFTEAVLRDTQGNPIMEAALKLVRVLVRYKDTGYFEGKVTPLLRSTYTYPLDGHNVGMPGQGAGQLALASGEFAIPVHNKARQVDVSLESSSYFPVTVPYAEWEADVTMKGTR